MHVRLVKASVRAHYILNSYICFVELNEVQICQGQNKWNIQTRDSAGVLKSVSR